MIDIIRNISFFIIALSILVAFHEYGHFWVARRCGVIIQRFSIGFGKVLWRKVGRDGTEYVICAIPLGGYVKMLDERVEDVEPGLLHGAFNRKPVLARIAIVIAGPMANFVFAIFAMWLMYLIGVNGYKPIVDQVIPDSIASQLAINSGEQIKAVNGDNTQTWTDVNHAIVGLIGKSSATVSVGLPNTEVMRTIKVDLTHWSFDPQSQTSLSSFGLIPMRGKLTLDIARIVDGSAGQQAGLMIGDVLISANGNIFEQWSDFATIIQQSYGTSIHLVYQRNGKEMATSLSPKLKVDKNGTKRGYAGVGPTFIPLSKEYTVTLKYGVLDAIGVGAEKTWSLTKLSFNMIGKLLTGDLSVKNLSGPISIAQGAGQSASYGFVAFLSFLALISVNLGIFNLLPLPVLDGGHLMYYFIELLTGKPVPEKIQDVGFRIGAALLFMLMSIAIFNDFTRL